MDVVEDVERKEAVRCKRSARMTEQFGSGYSTVFISLQYQESSRHAVHSVQGSSCGSRVEPLSLLSPVQARPYTYSAGEQDLASLAASTKTSSAIEVQDI